MRRKIKMAIAGAMIAVLLFSTLGIAAMASRQSNESIDQYLTPEDQFEEMWALEGLETDLVEDDDAQYLITVDQLREIRATVREMRGQNATHEEIMTQAQTMIHDFVQSNLESYGLTQVQIDEILAKMTELMDKRQEIRETARALWGQGYSRSEIRDEIQPLIEELKVLRGEMKDLLDQYGILPPIICQNHRQSRGWGRCRMGRRPGGP